jgi:hypothetical protein
MEKEEERKKNNRRDEKEEKVEQKGEVDSGEGDGREL